MGSEPDAIAAWSQALADVLLPMGRSGRPVLLACSDGPLAAAGAKLGADQVESPISLVAAVRANGGLPGAARAVKRFATTPTPRPAPPHLPALAVLVLAASRMGEDDASANAYYDRLGDLLGPPDLLGHPPYYGFAELCADGFASLAHWLADDEGGRRGYLHLSEPPMSRRYVGVPIGQAALRAADVRWLGTFFYERAVHLDAGWDPAGTLLHHPARHHMTAPARELLDDPERRPLLSAALASARASWDGSRSDADGRRVVATTLSAHLDPLAGSLHLSLRADNLSQGEDGIDPDGKAISVPAPPGELTIPFEWLPLAEVGPVRVLLGHRRSLHVLPGPLVMFVVGAGGFEYVPVATAPVWALTCLDRVSGGEPVDVDLPAGWRLLADVPTEGLPDDYRAQSPAQAAAPDALAIAGGLPLGDGGWLSARAPSIAGPSELTAPYLVDGWPTGRLEAGRSVRLSNLDQQPGVHRVVAGQLQLDVHLVIEGPRSGHGSVGWGLDEHASATAGPVEASATARSICGGLINDGVEKELPATGPWMRTAALVWALLGDGTMVPVVPPDADGWVRSVGWAAGCAWPLPRGTVWACQPRRRRVTLVDSKAGPVPPTNDAAHCVQFCEGVNVLDAVHAGDAIERWGKLVTACREAELV